MNIILLEKIRNLGELGDTVSVASGYGRNYLIPQGKAVPATAENTEHFETRRADLEAKAAEELAAAEKRAEGLAALTLTIPANAGDEGKLFGSVGTVDIAAAATAAGEALEKKEIRMPDGAIRTTGEFDVVVNLHTDVDATVKVLVVAEEE